MKQKMYFFLNYHFYLLIELKVLDAISFTHNIQKVIITIIINFVVQNQRPLKNLKYGTDTSFKPGLLLQNYNVVVVVKL